MIQILPKQVGVMPTAVADCQELRVKPHIPIDCVNKFGDDEYRHCRLPC